MSGAKISETRWWRSGKREGAAGSSPTALSVVPRTENGFWLLVLAALVLIYIFVFTQLTFSLYERCAYMNFDLAIFAQGTWLISQGEAPVVTVRGLHLLADHFSAILYLLAPLYRLAPTPQTLLLLQTVALALGALPVYGLARAKALPAEAGLIFAAAYLCYPALQWSNTYEFHPDSFAIPLLLSALYCLHRRRTAPYFLCLALACLTKETVGLTVAFVGLYAFLQGQRRLAVQTMLLGVAALAVGLGTVRFFNQAPSPYGYLYEQAPQLSLEDGGMYALKLLAPVLFLALAAPGALLPALPAIAANLLSSRLGMKNIEGQYTALIIPFVFQAAVLGYARLAARAGSLGRMVILANLMVWAVGGSLLWGPLGQDTGRLYTRRTQADARETRQLLRQIPAHASVSAQMPLGALLSERRELYHYPNPFQQNVSGGTRQALLEISEQATLTIKPEFATHVQKAPVEYVALSPNSLRFPFHSVEEYRKGVVTLLESPVYGVEAVGQGVILLRRGADRAVGLEKLAAHTGSDTREPERLLDAWVEQAGGWEKQR